MIITLWLLTKVCINDHTFVVINESVYKTLWLLTKDVYNT